jgi:hypothetical protein
MTKNKPEASVVRPSHSGSPTIVKVRSGLVNLEGGLGKGPQLEKEGGREGGREKLRDKRLCRVTSRRRLYCRLCRHSRIVSRRNCRVVVVSVHVHLLVITTRPGSQ